MSSDCIGRVPENMWRRMLRGGGRGGSTSRGGGGNSKAEYPCRVRGKAFPAVISSIIKNKRICGVQSKLDMNYISLV